MSVLGKEKPGGEGEACNIWCGDFFTDPAPFPKDVDVVIGNPPWGSVAADDTPPARWCQARGLTVPDRQIAAAFVWKAPHHTTERGRVCFVLPCGTVFNHSPTALTFQEQWVQRHAVDRVITLADFQRFLFEQAGHPAIVARYSRTPPPDARHPIAYWGPKADWTVTQAEVITVQPQDRTAFALQALLDDLKREDAPQIWKLNYWASPRDRRLLDRLSSLPRLRDITRQAGEGGTKRWLIAVGFQPFGEADAPTAKKTLTLPSKLFIATRSSALNLFLLEKDCQELPSEQVTVRRAIRDTGIFLAPHVLVAKGFTSTAFADFHVSFQDAVRGIHGREEDRNLLIFLAAYLRSPLARFFLFHTSSNWGISRQEIHVEEMLRLPFFLPEDGQDPARGSAIVEEVARIVTTAARQASEQLADRPDIVRTATAAIAPLVEEYFDVDRLERVLINDTDRVIIPSARPTRKKIQVPTIIHASTKQREAYVKRVCNTLNGWAKKGSFEVRGGSMASDQLGVGLVVLEKGRRVDAFDPMAGVGADLLAALNHVRTLLTRRQTVFDLVRGFKAFDRNKLYMVKPIGQRFWTETTALNDADEIAGTILMQSPQEGA